MPDFDPKSFLSALFAVAVKAADPADALSQHLPPRPKGRTIVVGAGKAASQMAKAFEDLWDGPLEGVVVGRRGGTVPTQHIEVLEAAHPVPDRAGLQAAQRLVRAVEGLTPDDLVVALISGGGSALLPWPGGELTFEHEMAVNEALLRSGAPITAMNTVRKHISGIKGGRLAKAAAPARVISLVVSDVSGDDPAMVASGPTVADATTPQDALAIIDEYRIAVPDVVMAHLRSPAAFAPKPDDADFTNNRVHVIASAQISLQAAALEARKRGVTAAILSDAIEGEARDIGLMHAALARNIAQHDQPFAKPVVLLSGGETTVTIRDGRYGKGGRNSEFLLSFAREIEGLAGIDALAADTDGIDGSEDNAGAFADGGSMGRMRGAGIDPRQMQIDHDAWTAFNAVGDLFMTGPTGTNVNDFRAIVIR